MKINLFRTAFILVGFCILSTFALGQTTFEDRHLKMFDKISSAETFNQVTEIMNKNQCVLEEKADNPNGDGEYFTFTTSYGAEVIISYTKRKDLVFIEEEIATINLVFCEMELKDKGFTLLSTTKQKEDGVNITVVKWGKTAYPYKFVLYKSEGKVSQLTLQSKISSGY